MAKPKKKSAGVSKGKPGRPNKQLSSQTAVLIKRNATAEVSKRKPGRSSIISDKQFSSQIAGLIKRNATDQDIYDELHRHPHLKVSFHPHLEDAFWHAAKNKRYAIIPKLLERQDARQWNALHLAVIYNDDDFILQQFGTTIPDLGCHKEPDTPLHLAITLGKPKTCKLLLENGCWKEYTGKDRDLVGHMVMYQIHFGGSDEPIEEWCEFLQWLYTAGVMPLDSKNGKNETVTDFMRRCNIPDQVKTVMEGIKSG